MQLRLPSWLISLVMVLALVVAGCTSQPSASSPPTADAQSTQAVTSTANSPTNQAVAMTTPDNAQQFPGLPRLEGKATIEVTMKDGGTIVMEIDGTNAPITAGNFVDLVQRGVYDGSMFHRVVRDPQPFVAQGGDPQSRNPSVPQTALGTGSFIDPATAKPRYIPLEIKAANDSLIYSRTFADARVMGVPKLRHTRGAVAMARSPQPDSASAQFYIALADLDFLDGSYAVFGYVTSGMDAVDKIQQGDRIGAAKVTKGAENLKK